MSAAPAGHRIPISWWVIAAVLLVAAGALLALAGSSQQETALPYSAFLDQVDAGNVASVTFTGTDISGQLKRPLGVGGNEASLSAFRSKVPDFGDPALIPELRRHHVLIAVTTPSSWAWLLARVPVPMLIFLGAMIVAALVRLLRGGVMPQVSGPSAFPAHGVMRLLSHLFAARNEISGIRSDEERKRPDAGHQ